MKLGAIVTSFAAISAPLFADYGPVRSLDDFEWSNRLLIANVSNEQFAQLKQDLIEYQNETLERKLVILVLNDGELKTFNLEEDPANPDNIRAEITTRLINSDIALIGLDGGAKARFEADNFELPTVFAQIDRMPMRQAELRERASKR
ncbi:MAG: DUF4174 domain-containing protein [Puniceicoccales bacterium]